MFSDPTFWVAVSLLIFFGLLVYLGVPKMVTSSLDARSEQIRKEIEDARQLREDAQAMLSDYRRKQKEAEEEAKAIIDAAQTEAERYAEETRAAIQAQMARRTELAERRIARAEQTAVAEVRAAAADVAVAAAQRVLADSLDERTDAKLIDRAIKELPTRLN
ncbi:MAG: ATP F0F1 synthase subunit B [Alphaproteobacteria bacterium]